MDNIIQQMQQLQKLICKIKFNWQSLTHPLQM